METDDISHVPRPLHFLWAALLAIGFLGVVLLILPEPYSMPPQQADEQSEPRRQVLVLLIDSTDHVDAHGDHVRSVIRQYCGACAVRPINVHGNMSTPRLQLALKQVQEIVRGVEPSTTVVVNLSWGTYTYNVAMHTLIRGLHDLGAVLIASAGNDNTSKPFYPAAFDEVLGICSISRYRKSKAAYSNFGPWVSLCAPGLHYVSQPLQHGGVASGTSFASPMVAGVLGQRLLDAPCATPQQGLQALLRTADPFPDGASTAATGRLNRNAATHYLNTLYGCQTQATTGTRILRTLRRITSDLALFLGLLIYATVSIFAFPFLFAYVLERFRMRADHRLNIAVQMIYTQSPDYRSQRLDTLKQRFWKAGRLRHREATELLALLHAQHLYDEPCGWCEGQQLILANEASSMVESTIDGGSLPVCARCGLKPEASTLSL